jgi:hypothetical protein
VRGHHTNNDSVDLFPFIERRTQENEEHTKEESRTLCSYSVVIGKSPLNPFGVCSKIDSFAFLIINERKYERREYKNKNKYENAYGTNNTRTSIETYNARYEYTLKEIERNLHTHKRIAKVSYG